MKTYLSPILAFLFVLSFSACSDKDDDNNNTNNPNELSISAKLAADANYSILSEALDRTGLSGSLDSEGSFTLFAPNDAAFTAFINDEGYNDLDALIQAIGSTELRAILTYHLINQDLAWGQFQSGYYRSMSQTNAKDSLSFYAAKSNVLKLNDRAEVVEANMEASNGHIHGVNNVLVPLSIYGLLAVHPDYSSLEAAIGLADGNLDSYLSDESETFTFFAPNNTAFDTLVARSPNVSNLFEYVASLGTDELAKVLLYHGTKNALVASELQTGNIASLADDGAGGKLEFFVNIGAQVRLIDNNSSTEDAVVTETDIVGSNGVLHLIDAVILPN